MAILVPLLDAMSARARVAWPFIQKAAAKGLGAEEIIAALEEGGIPTFRRSDMLALIREAVGGELLKSDIGKWPEDALLPFNRVRESVTKIVAPFSYTLEVTFLDAETGEELSMLRQAHSSQLMPTGAVSEDFLSNAPNFAQYQGVELTGARVIDVVRAGEQGVI